MFNDRYGLTQAVLEGRKTMTRRIIPDEFFSLNWDTRDDTLVSENDFGDFIDIRSSTYCRYHVGEVAAVAQSYQNAGYKRGYYRDEDAYIPIFSKAEPHKDIAVSPAAWTNKMFVKAELMLHRIRITDIRVERLQDISDEDCIKEGVLPDPFPFGKGYVINDWMRHRGYDFPTPREAFAALIDKVSGRGTWESNPWCFAYEFELVK